MNKAVWNVNSERPFGHYTFKEALLMRQGSEFFHRAGAGVYKLQTFLCETTNQEDQDIKSKVLGLEKIIT